MGARSPTNNNSGMKSPGIIKYDQNEISPANNLRGSLTF